MVTDGPCGTSPHRRGRRGFTGEPRPVHGGLHRPGSPAPGSAGSHATGRFLSRVRWRRDPAMSSGVGGRALDFGGAARRLVQPAFRERAGDRLTVRDPDRAEHELHVLQGRVLTGGVVPIGEVVMHDLVQEVSPARIRCRDLVGRLAGSVPVLGGEQADQARGSAGAIRLVIRLVIGGPNGTESRSGSGPLRRLCDRSAARCRRLPENVTHRQGCGRVPESEQSS